MRSRSRSSSAGSLQRKTSKDDFQELERARRRKELEDIMNMPTKSILKRRMDSSETDSPIVMQVRPQNVQVFSITDLHISLVTPRRTPP